MELQKDIDSCHYYSIVGSAACAAGSDKFFDDKDSGTAAAAGAEGEMYPYVSFTINIDS